MNQAIASDQVLIDVDEGLGIITLNRPEALNALSLDMIRIIAATLQRWEDDAAVQVVVFNGAGERAFCSGGDIKSFYHAGMDFRRGLASNRVPVVFFAEEYSLNKQIAHYPKPTVAFMDGFTMGGGYGIAGHCDLRIATDKTVFAMPEAGIGFFPDVGSMYHLQQCPGHYGRYLALTGQGVDGQTACAAGLADVYVGASSLDDVLGKLKANPDIEQVINDLGDTDCADIPHMEEINQVFQSLDIMEIFERLEELGSEFGDKVTVLLGGRSPVSLRVIAKYLEKSQDFSVDEVLGMDFTIVQHFIGQGDMYEGIRAQLIDKDRTPQWEHACVSEVTEEHVNTYFTPTGYDLKDVQIF